MMLQWVWIKELKRGKGDVGGNELYINGRFFEAFRELILYNLYLL